MVINNHGCVLPNNLSNTRARYEAKVWYGAESYIAETDIEVHDQTKNVETSELFLLLL